MVFAWVRALPGDPSAALLASGRGSADLNMTWEAAGEVHRLYGLDRPLHQQYLSWLGRSVRLDFGQSITTRQDVATELRRRFPATVELAAAALVLTVGIGIPLGFASARRAHSWFDHLSLGACLVGVSIRVFFLAFVSSTSSRPSWAGFRASAGSTSRATLPIPPGCTCSTRCSRWTGRRWLTPCAT